MKRNKGIEKEKAWFKKNKGRRHLGSGAIPGYPEDGVKGQFMIQVKSTDFESVSLKRKDLAELYENAALHSKLPMLIVLFPKDEEAIYDTRPLNEWAVVPLFLYDDMKLWEKNHGDAKKRKV